MSSVEEILAKGTAELEEARKRPTVFPTLLHIAKYSYALVLLWRRTSKYYHWAKLTIDFKHGIKSGLMDALTRDTDEISVRNSTAQTMQLKSVQETNPNHPPAWIASARLKEVTGCETCPNSEDLWLEAGRLLPVDTAKNVMTAQALDQNVSEFEQDMKAKKRLFRKALEHIPNIPIRFVCGKLPLNWKSSQNKTRKFFCLEQSNVAHGSSVEIWLALARLETYENERPSILWLPSANGVEIDQSRILVKNKLSMPEKSGAVLTCQVIIKFVIGHGIEEEDRKQSWVHSSVGVQNSHSLETLPADTRNPSGYVLLNLNDNMKRVTFQQPVSSRHWLFKRIRILKKIWLAAVKVESEKWEYD
uniref:Uncharacterized protein n=1 Tax=Daphnia galeata TaxID=27404 RepID=A0A8J2WN28_9CRUS|nr:unnamed protein product [Daphnia galeata]